MTYRNLGYSIITALKQTFDDTDFGLLETVYHIQLAANKLIAQVIEKNGSNGRFMATYSAIPTSTDTVTGLPYITIPAQVYDIQFDGGIVNISYNLRPEDDCCDPPVFAQTWFSQTALDKVHRLYGNPNEKPSGSNPYFYRVGDKIFLLGVTCLTVPNVNVVLYTSLNPANIPDLDADIIPDEYSQQIFYSVMQLGRFIANIPDERRNEGADKQWEEQQKLGRVAQANLPQQQEAQ